MKKPTRIAELERALRPFAKAWDDMQDFIDRHGDHGLVKNTWFIPDRVLEEASRVMRPPLRPLAKTRTRAKTKVKARVKRRRTRGRPRA